MQKTPEKLSNWQKSFRERLREEMDTGIADSRDPINAGLPELFARTTTIYSPWYTRVCPVCKLKFREGDRVRLCPNPKCRQAYHDDDQYQLHCWQGHFANGNVCKETRFDPIAEREIDGCDYTWSGTFPDEQNPTQQGQLQSSRVVQITTQLLHGLETIWTPFGAKAVYEVQPEDPLIGHRCPLCRFLIRAGDHLVKCPCGKCDTYFHEDIFRHLTCWNDWNGIKGHDYCPTTGAKIEEAEDNKQ